MKTARMAVEKLAALLRQGSTESLRMNRREDIFDV
jgi:hypothetical protein